jgi:beta-lactamase regulating signal transducer with metallopeptidase domain
MKLLIALGQTAFAWIWQTSLYATLLIVLVFVLQMILAKWLTPRLRYTLSLLVLIRLLLPVMPCSVFSFENLCPPAARLANPAAILPSSDQSIKDETVVQQSHASSRLVPAVVNPIRISVSGTLGLVWASGCLGLLMLAGWRLGRWHGLIRRGR